MSNSDGIPIHNGRVNLSSTAGASVYADTLPVPVADDNGRKGWLYVKSAGAEKLNYYFYSQGSHAVTLAELENLYYVGIIDNWTNAMNVPFLVVYTKMQGDGQDGGAWYRTKRTFGIPSHTRLNLGQRTQFSMANNPTPSFPFPHITLTAQTVVGPNANDEEILTMAVHTDSGAAVGISNIISHVGWKSTHMHNSANPNIFLSSN